MHDAALLLVLEVDHAPVLCRYYGQWENGFTWRRGREGGRSWRKGRGGERMDGEGGVEGEIGEREG